MTRPTSRVLLAAISTLLLVACERKLTGPAPTVSQVAPSAVCTEQLTTTISLTGDGLSPLVTDSLTAAPQLNLPAISLVPSVDLTGATASGDPVVIPDDPAAPADSRARWTSQQAMEVDLSPELALAPGLYGIHVANRNGKSTDFADAVLAVPPPQLTRATPDLICNDEAADIVLAGDFFIRSATLQPTVTVGGKTLAPKAMADCRALPGPAGLEACRSLTVTIDPKALTVGTHAFVVKNPETVACLSTTSQVTVTVVADPTLTRLVPDFTCTALGATAVVLTGTGFLGVDAATPSVVIGTQTFPGTLENCTEVTGVGLAERVRSCTTLHATIPQGVLAPTGLFSTFPAKVLNPAPASCETKEAVSFTTVPAPTLASVVPDFTCTEQGATALLATGTGFLGVDGATASLVIGSQTLTGTLENCTAITTTGLAEVVQSCTTLRATLPTGALAPMGLFSNFDAKVVNPAPAGCETKESNTFTTLPAPTLLAVVPDLVCTAASAVNVTLTGTGFISTAPDSATTPTLPLVAVGGLTLTPTGAGGCTDVTGPGETVRSCTTLTVSIPQAAAVGVQPITVTNPAPAACSTAQSVTLVVAPQPVVASLTPELTSAVEADVSVSIQGTGFLKVGSTLPGVEVGTVTLTATAATGCTVIVGTTTGAQSCTGLTVLVPRGTSPGEQPVVVVNPAPAACTSAPKKIFLAPAPVLASLTPPGLCVGSTGTTPIVLDGTDFLRLGGTAVPAVTIGTHTYSPTVDGTNCTTLTGYSQSLERCTRLTVNVPSADFTTSGAYDTTVRNPAPAAASSTPAVPLSVTTPPLLTSAVPASICAGGGSLTLTGANFTSTMQVTLLSPTPQQAVSVTLTGTTTALATFAGPLPVGGPYPLRVTTAAGACFAQLASQAQVTPGPVVFFVDPSIVYNGITTQATVYASGFSASGLTVSIRINGTSALQTVTAAYNPSKANRILVTLPQGLAPGSYDVLVNDSVTTQCPGALPNAFRVVSATTLTLLSIDPPFGYTGASTGVTITADGTAGGGLQALPRFYLNPSSGTGVAIPLESVSLISNTRATAVVPSGELVGLYDLIVVNPDGGVGVLTSAFRVLPDAVPFIDSVSPQYLTSQQTAAAFTLSGGNFRTPAVTLRCKDTTGAAINVTATVLGTPTATSVNATVNTTTLPNGSVCVVRSTNGDGSYADFSAIVITNPAQKPTGFTGGPAMLTARRGLVAEAGDITRAAQFLYALGGDDGAATPTAFDTVESAPLDIFGIPGQFTAQRYRMTVPRAGATGQRLGRWLYMAGGRNGNTVHATVERSYLLDPKDRVTVTDLDLSFTDVGGLGAGVYTYRVSAVMSGSDPFNPTGENLPSDPFPINFPGLNGGTVLTLHWAAITGAVKYRVYRTQVNGAAGSELLLAEVTAPTTSYTDDNTLAPSGAGPLPLGSTGVWSVVGTLPGPREAAGSTVVADPAAPGQWYLYVVGGRDATSVQSTALKVPVTIAADASQTVGTIATSSALGTARWQLGVVTANGTSAPVVGTAQYLYAYGGSTGAMTSSATQAALVTANGDLGAWTTVNSMTPARTGFAPVAVNNFLYAFGGTASGSTTPVNSGGSAEISNAPPALVSWQSTSAQMTARRFLPGSTLQGAFFYVLGGKTDALPATQSTDRIVW